MRFERWAPSAVAGLSFAAAIYLQAPGGPFAALAPVTLTIVMWAAGFALSLTTLVTTSLFTVLMSPKDSVIGRQRPTAAYRTFAGYVVNAALLGLGAVVLTGAFLASSLFAPLHAALTPALPVWWAVMAGALASNLRTYGVFLIWIRAPQPQPAPLQQGFAAEAATIAAPTAPAPRLVTPTAADAWAASAADTVFSAPFPSGATAAEPHPWTAG
jgi:hypothetical protein